MNKTAGLVVALALSTALAATAKGPPKDPCNSKEGCVPNEETAIAIAVAVWNPIYGKEKIESEKPFHARLSKGVWTVEGTLPEGWKGGTAEALIAKDDGRILRVTHYK
ncbi:MAG: YbbC/YhhH family protein [Elusimicrobia bacterium]|nr:YbbC/YhhH family protein [Elusimicrobiota bacterium]